MDWSGLVDRYVRSVVCPDIVRVIERVHLDEGTVTGERHERLLKAYSEIRCMRSSDCNGILFKEPRYHAQNLAEVVSTDTGSLYLMLCLLDVPAICH